MCRRVLSRGGAPVNGRPESTKYIGSALQLFGSQWNRAVLAVFGSWIQACFSTAPVRAENPEQAFATGHDLFPGCRLAVVLADGQPGTELD